VREFVGDQHAGRGISSIHIEAATTEIATCMVVAFWCGTSRRDSSMVKVGANPPGVVRVAHENAPKMSAPAVISSFMIRWLAFSL